MPLEIQDKDGTKYIKGKGNFYYLSKDKKDALDEIPQGFKIVKKNNRLFVKKEG